MEGNGKVDLAIFDTKTQADKGFKLDILDVRTGEPSGFWIMILGDDSSVMQEWRREDSERSAERLKREMRAEETQQEKWARVIERLVTATIGWSDNALIDGVPFPFSKENARKLYSDDTRFPTIREQVAAGIQNRANFLPASAPSS